MAAPSGDVDNEMPAYPSVEMSAQKPLQDQNSNQVPGPDSFPVDQT